VLRTLDSSPQVIFVVCVVVWAINYHHFVTIAWVPGSFLPDWAACTFNLAKCTYYFKIAVGGGSNQLFLDSTGLDLDSTGLVKMVRDLVHLQLLGFWDGPSAACQACRARPTHPGCRACECARSAHKNDRFPPLLGPKRWPWQWRRSPRASPR
jgi:hypothetical protein